MVVKNEFVNPQASYNIFSALIQSDYPYKLTGAFKDKKTKELFCTQFEIIKSEFSNYNVKGDYYRTDGRGYINLAFLPHYLILCFRFANSMIRNKIDRELCEAVYYSQRIRTGTDLFYTTQVGKYLFPVHPTGSVLNSHAQIGDGFRFYQGVTIGHSPAEDGSYRWPVLGKGVTMYPGSSIFGKCNIGDNVLLSTGTRILNQDIPSNSIVFGHSPDITIKPHKNNNLFWLEL